ncbi:MAG: hypothetical protein LBQ19_06650 [Synergistaceae bacterium]|jgi:hypothetical protein|nr:hypothetical protein [Synergistaceae bacterium]
MRVFSIVGLLVSLMIVGWYSASYLVAATSGGPPDSIVASPAADGTAPTDPAARMSPIDRARDLASKDLERQKMMEELSRK